VFNELQYLTETASGIGMERLLETLQQKADWFWSQYIEGRVDIHVVPGDHHDESAEFSSCKVRFALQRN
jgi:hypothetical protein